VFAASKDMQIHYICGSYPPSVRHKFKTAVKKTAVKDSCLMSHLVNTEKSESHPL